MSLSDNPFCITNITPEDFGAELVRKLEVMELSALEETADVSGIKTMLLNPARRLIAEIGWFTGVPDSRASYLREMINAGKYIPFKNVRTPLDILNLLAYNMRFVVSCSEDKIAKAVNILDRAYSKCDETMIFEHINSKRSRANFPEVSISDVERALRIHAEILRKDVAFEMQKMSAEKYLKVVSLVADTMNESSCDKAFQNEMFVRYKVNTCSQLSSLEEEIRKYSEMILRAGSSRIAAEEAKRMDVLIRLYGRIVYPLIKKAEVEGLVHRPSHDLAWHLRSTYVDLVNEKCYNKPAAELARTIKESFSGMPELVRRIDDDLMRM